MTEKLILEKLDKLERSVDKIEGAVGLIAVQAERINNVSSQVDSLWRKYEEALGAGGIITQIKNHQAGCPRDAVKDALSRQWVVVALLGTTVVGIALKTVGQ